MIPFRVLLEENGYNIYDGNDMSEWLLGNIVQTEAIQLGKELLKATGTVDCESLLASQEELVEALTSVVAMHDNQMFICGQDDCGTVDNTLHNARKALANAEKILKK